MDEHIKAEKPPEKKGGLGQVIRDSGLALLITGFVWLLAVGCYAVSDRNNPAVVSGRMQAMVHNLNEAYRAGASDDVKHGIILKGFLFEENATLWEGIFMHLAIALFVAGVLILSVDWATRYMTKMEFADHLAWSKFYAASLAKEVSESVWNAIFKRFVPDEVSKEIESILKSEVCRIRPHYTIRFMRDVYTNLPSGRIVVERGLHYKIMNLSAADTQWPFTLRILSLLEDHMLKDENGHDVALPFIKSVFVEKKNVLDDNASSAPKPLREFSRTFTLSGKDKTGSSLEVHSVVEEVLGSTDRGIYTITTPSVGLEVSVINEMPDRIEVQDVYLSSGKGKKLNAIGPYHWEYNGAILGGVALILSWRAKTRLLAAPEA